METPTLDLKEAYRQIINRLDAIFSRALYHPLTLAEQAEADELRQRAWLIQTELSQRERRCESLFA